MKVTINPRENGACPICKKKKNCSIKKQIQEAIIKFHDPLGTGMELVIYECPRFEEKF